VNFCEIATFVTGHTPKSAPDALFQTLMETRMRVRFPTLALAAALTSFGAQAAPNLVTNGDFEANGGVGQISGGVSYATGWSTSTPTDAAHPFNFILNTTADDGTSGFNGGFPSVNTPSLYTNIFVWGPDNGVNNGFTGSQNGGDFFGSDGAYATAPIFQTINGLTAGKTYTLSFEWAASQFTDRTGETTQGWNVSFGDQTFSTSAFTLGSQGFSGWMNVSTTFTASAASQTLSFMAFGTPAGLPPFSLLDGVSLTENVVVTPVPEPASVALMVCGLGALGLAKRRRQQAQATKA